MPVRDLPSSPKPRNQFRFLPRSASSLPPTWALASSDPPDWAQLPRPLLRPTSTTTTAATQCPTLIRSARVSSPPLPTELAHANALCSLRATSVTETLDVPPRRELPPRTSRHAKRPSPQLPLLSPPLSSQLSASESLCAHPTQPSDQSVIFTTDQYWVESEFAAAFFWYYLQLFSLLLVILPQYLFLTLK